MEPPVLINSHSGPFGAVPTDVMRHIFALLPSGDDAAYFGATCKQLHTLVVHSRTWKDRLRREYPLTFSRLKNSEDETDSPLWYLEYRKDKAARHLLVGDRNSRKTTNLVDVLYAIPFRAASHLGRGLCPTIVENGKKLALRADRHFMVLDLATGKTVKRLRFGTELLVCHQVCDGINIFEYLLPLDSHQLRFEDFDGWYPPRSHFVYSWSLPGELKT